MYKSILITDNERIRNECEKIAGAFDELELISWNEIQANPKLNPNAPLLFIILSDFQYFNLPEVRKYIEKFTPETQVIVYNRTLAVDDLGMINDFNDLKLIVGENRQKDLQTLIQTIINNYWRKIPYEELGIDWSAISPRMRQAMHYMETCDIRDLNSHSIAKYLNISPGYFSQAFKKETGQLFRDFREKLLTYYGEQVLSRYKLSAHKISRLLGYSELSSFSRSFKRRQGVSPTQFRKKLTN